MRSLFHLSLLSFIFLFLSPVAQASDCSVLGSGWYWDTYKGSCQFVNTPSSAKSLNTGKKSTSAKTTSSNSSSEAACRAQLNGKNGCYSYKNGQCIGAGFEFCKSEATCKRNGGAFDAGSCVDPSEVTVSDACRNDISKCNYVQCSLKGDWVNGKCVQPGAAANGSTQCGKNADTNPASFLDDSNIEANQQCQCKYQNSSSLIPGKYVAFGTDCAGEDDPGAVADTMPEGIDSCLNDIRDKVQKCTNSAEKAVKSCDTESTLNKDQQSTNSNIKTGQQVLNAIGQLSIGKKAGSGEVDTCVLTTLGTQTTAGLLDTYKEGCSSDVSSCKSDCDGLDTALSNRDAIIESCKSATGYQGSNLALSMAINAKLNNLVNQYRDANDNCNTNAEGKKTVLEDYTGRSITSAQQAAKVCNCQNVAGATNCNNLPSMAQCKLTPGLSGCSVYQNNCVANPNSPACVCVTDPNGNACKLALNNNPNLQGMVSALNTMPTNSTGSVSTGSPYGLTSMKDLMSSLGDDATKVASATADGGGPGSPFASAQGGGGGGAGGGGGGGLQQQGEGGPAGEEEKKGIGGGFITSAKNFLSDMFGGKKGGNSVGGSGNGFKVKPNPDSWRPKLRIPGSAGDEYALGSKNKNIFDIMTKRYSDQTHTFIQTP